jgi:hypothetical protein
VLVEACAAIVGVPFHKLAAPKLLLAPQGDGLQEIHWDAPAAWMARDKYSFVLYCSKHTKVMSTYMPRFPADRRLLSFREVQPSAATMQRSSPLLDRTYFHAVQVEQGDVMFFRQSVPHYGGANDSAAPRVVCFGIASDSYDKKQDYAQIFRHNYVGEAAGIDSQSFAQALVDAKRNHPIAHMQKKKERDQATRLLQREGLWDEYNQP